MTEHTTDIAPETPPSVPEAATEAAAAPATKKRSEFADFMLFLVKLAIFVFILRTFIVAPFNIPSESMMPKLLKGDYLLVTKWNYGYSKYSMPWSLPLIPGRVFASAPERGEVVVFKAPPTQEQDYIKRVIGLPGDTVQMINGQLILNGKPVPKVRKPDLVLPETPNGTCLDDKNREQAPNGGTQCRYAMFQETLPNGKVYDVIDNFDSLGDNTAIFTVPAGHMFLMGDNRDHSQDSRFPAKAGGAIGMVPQENLVGRAWVMAFSTDGSASWIKPWTWFSAARWERVGTRF